MSSGMLRRDISCRFIIIIIIIIIVMFGGPSLLFRVRGEGAGDGVLGEGQPALPRQLGGCGIIIIFIK